MLKVQDEVRSVAVRVEAEDAQVIEPGQSAIPTQSTSTQNGPWPLSRTMAQVITTMIINSTRPYKRGKVLWSYVAHMTGYGSTSATLLCEWLGLDPHERRTWRRL